MTQRTVTLTRMFDAPRERVFAAWTRAEHLVHWFSPKDYGVHSCEADPRAGGIFRLCMRAPQGQDYWVHGTYREVAPPARLVIACVAHDEQGVAQLEEVIDVTLDEQGGRTRLSLKASASGVTPKAARMLEGMEEGWYQTVDRLGALFMPKPSYGRSL